MAAAPRKLLLVDDDDDTRDMLALLLKRRGYAVDAASDGMQALRMLQDETIPDLVLMDLNMPRMDGWELTRRISNDTSLATLPIVLLSGRLDLADVAASLGAVSYFTKPVHFEALCAVLDSHLE